MWTSWKNCAININRTCVRAQKGVVNMMKHKTNIQLQKDKVILIHKFLQLSPEEQRQVIDRIKEIRKR